MRPPLPVPSILLGSRSCSATNLRTAGLSGGVSRSSASALLLSPSASSLSADPSPASASPPPAPSSSTAMMSPEPTVAPSSALISLSTPSATAGTSSMTLSVSSSQMFSSRETRSPGFLFQTATVASVTDSGNAGTLTSILIPSPIRFHRRERPIRLLDYSPRVRLPDSSALRTNSSCSWTWTLW